MTSPSIPPALDVLLHNKVPQDGCPLGGVDTVCVGGRLYYTTSGDNCADLLALQGVRLSHNLVFVQSPDNRHNRFYADGKVLVEYVKKPGEAGNQLLLAQQAAVSRSVMKMVNVEVRVVSSTVEECRLRMRVVGESGDKRGFYLELVRSERKVRRPHTRVAVTSKPPLRWQQSVARMFTGKRTRDCK